jgi:hypothetical protein
MTLKYLYTCDLCGQEIKPSEEYVTLEISDSQKLTKDRLGKTLRKYQRTWNGGWAGHYHAGSVRYGEKNCYEKLDDLIELARAQAQNIGAIPVANRWEIERLREQHVQPGRPDRDSVWRSLEGLDIPPRARSSLIRNQIDLQTVAQMSDDELLRLDGIGQVAVRRLREAIASREAAV